MAQQHAAINDFLKVLFRDVLRLEEKSLAQSGHKNLSLSEIHVLEAIEEHGGEGMNAAATSLGVTKGTLTVSVKTLEQKGYLSRERDKRDRRRVVTTLSPAAQTVLNSHAEFHNRLVAGITENLSPDETRALCEMLDKLHGFFGSI